MRPAIHTERELKQVSEEALLKSAEWLPKGVEVFWTSVDIPTNTVQVGVSGSAATVEPILRERFGPAIHVVEDEAVEPIVCTSRTNCTPWRGGIDVNNIDHPADG